ncbi:MAG: hypothetical protein V1493_06715, partial [Candidatus Diapherotrites archaeon]
MKRLLVALALVALTCLLLARFAAGETIGSEDEITQPKAEPDNPTGSQDDTTTIGQETDIRQDREPALHGSPTSDPSTITAASEIEGSNEPEPTTDATTTDSASSQPPATEGCREQWSCISTYFRALQKEDCTFEPEKYCEGGCSNGECRQACKSCSDFSGQCGSFDNGCGKTIPCGCDSGRSCTNGKCCRAISCKAGECGSKGNDCGQSVQCGSCETGFECNAFNQCVLKQQPKELEISNVQAFPYSTYAIITWQTSIEADSRTEFGETESLGSSESDWATTTEHYILLHGFKPETKYFFKVVSAAGSTSKESGIQSFKTTPWKDEPLKILQILVSPESKTQFEGQAFSFTAITNSQKPGELEFFWDFGDDLNGAGQRVFHSFYGLGFEKEKDFNVKVIAKDSNGQT